MIDCKMTTIRTACGFLVLAVLGFALARPAESAKPSQPFSLSIRVLHDSARVGSPIQLQVALKNTSKHEIGILKSAPEADYTVEVRDLSGRLAPDTDFGRKLKDPSSVSVSTSSPLYNLKPGETLRDEIQIDKLYEMSTPGKFSIQVSRAIPEEIGSGVVKSNTVTMIITP